MNRKEARRRLAARGLVIAAAVLGLIGGLLSPTAAVAGPGSLVAGVAWVDVNRNGVQDPGEPLEGGVTVQLISSADGTVIASTTTDSAGAYSFADVPDGAYVVRVTAPGGFRFPVTATGDNDFVRTGSPAPGQPERGVSGPIAITGAAQVPDVDAGLQPIADLRIERLALADACEGFAQTGTPPFDATDGPGQDTGTANCIVRVGDTVRQQYAVSLTGLPSGVSVPNVVVEFTLSSPDGAEIELTGPGTNSLPAGCLAAANGANPPSSRTVNADGSITVTCNVGTMSSSVAALEIGYRAATDSAVPSHMSVSAAAYAGQGGAGSSNTVSGPTVEVTGAAEWDLEKVHYTGGYYVAPGPEYTLLTVGGVAREGYLVRYEFNITDMLAGAGGSQLVWPASFVDVMPEFPGARITECRRSAWYDPTGDSLWRLNCPSVSEVQGNDGWQLSIEPLPGLAGFDPTQGHTIMTVFIPLDEMNRAIDPSWQPGDDTPTGVFSFDNRAEDTEHWAMNGGRLNYGDGLEPGWDGTGNNRALVEGDAAPPQWDLQKQFRGGPIFSTETIDGEQVGGYYVEYDLSIVDLAGPDNVAPWLDDPVTFTDRMVSHPGAILLSCRPFAQGDPARINGTPTCETGVQPSDGWEMSWVPNQQGFDRRRGDFIARIFIPLDQVPDGLCEGGATLDLRNEAVGTENWTVQGQPNNGSGLEPGWDGSVATGNNVDERNVRPGSGQCGVLSGDKRFYDPAPGGSGYFFEDPTRNRPTFAGDVLASYVTSSANNPNVVVPDLGVCDVFDVSVLRLRPEQAPWVEGSGGVNPTDYVIEYAVGPNDVDTQDGPKVIVGQNPTALYPVDSSSLRTAAAGCRSFTGPWSADPEATFGSNWRDLVNMVRIRPITPGLVETGPFTATLRMHFDVRGVYNGGPNAGQAIPADIRLVNEGGWPTGRTGTGWTIAERQVRYEGMQLAVTKSVDPAQYLPGKDVVWDLGVDILRTTIGATMFNLRVVDTIPVDLHFDLACTQDLLPPGVTVSYDAQTRRATFQAGDIEIVSAPNQKVFASADPSVPRLRVCTSVDSLAQPGDTYVNRVQALADNSENAPEATATIQVVGAGQLGITKRVDKLLVASGEEYTWTLDWGNTSTVIAFQPPDVIDVLPWNGDGDPAAGSARDQYSSEYEGSVHLSRLLEQPAYVRGETTGAVPGVWYYSTAAPATLHHDPRDPSNDAPEDPGGIWLTADEILAGAGIDAVTAVRFVSEDYLPTASLVRANIPMVSVSNELDNVYVNRAVVFSDTVPDQPLLSTEPYVLMPGFTLGDLVWMDRNGNGRFDGGEQGVPGVTVQVLDESGETIATRVTDADGRWSVDAIPAGTYTVFIPPSMFRDGGPLADTVVRTVGSSAANAPNENVDNNNTEATDPASTGLLSTPVTLENRYDGDRLVGGNGPSDDDVAALAGPLIPDDFTNFTVDLALMPEPGIDIEKATNGQDADTPAGPNVTVGGAVRWTFVVTNVGGVDLTDVTVTDDRLDASAIDCDGTGSNVVPGPLAPEASITCVATGTASLGQYENLGAVSGIDPTQVVVTDEDPSHYFGIEPAVDIEKATNGVDADTPTGPLVTVDGAVRWTYVVTNTGNAPLSNVTVTDDRLEPTEIDCAGTGGNVIPGPLAAGASFTCVADGTAELGQYANTGTVVATGPETTDVDGNPVAGAQVTDADPSHYFGVAPAIDIEKATDGEDADEPTGPLIASGSVVTWTYVVTNTGTTPLTFVTVTDDRVAADRIDCDGTGSNMIVGPVAAGDTFECQATGTAAPGQYANLGTVVGFGPETTDVDGETVAGQRVTDDDPSHYFGLQAAVDIEKATNGQDADDAPGVPLTVGDVVEWTYVVTNTGNVPLTNVTVTDDKVAASEIWCDGTEVNVVAGPLEPGGSFTCSAFGVATAGAYTNTGTVTGDSADLGITVTDVDPSHYTASEPGALPTTGGVIPIAAAVGGGLLAMLGLLLFAIPRRRRT